jgi:hypothetical protein
MSEPPAETELDAFLGSWPPLREIQGLLGAVPKTR